MVSSGGTAVVLSLGSTASSWVDVWSTSLGGGSYSMDGLQLGFARQAVVAIKLSSSPVGAGSFEGWEEVMFYFGHTASSGSVHVSSSKVLEAVSGESLLVSSESVSLSAYHVLRSTASSSVTPSQLLSMSSQTSVAAGLMSESLSLQSWSSAQHRSSRQGSST